MSCYRKWTIAIGMVLVVVSVVLGVLGFLSKSGPEGEALEKTIILTVAGLILVSNILLGLPTDIGQRNRKEDGQQMRGLPKWSLREWKSHMGSWDIFWCVFSLVACIIVYFW